MANLIEFAFDGITPLCLNVENCYRVDNDGDADSMRFFYNVASAAGTNVWVTTVKFTTTITESQQKDVEKLVRSVNQTPGGVVSYRDIDGNDVLTLHATTPFAVASEAQP